MSSSAWPPQLKAWVQDCLAKATTANKAAVNAELKQILFQAHKDGTVQTTDWTKVQLQALKAQAARISVSSPLKSLPASYSPLVIPASPNPSLSGFTPAPVTTGGKNKKKRKTGDGSTTTASTFPSPYHFASAEDTEAKARRAARFQRDAPTPTPSNGNANGGVVGLGVGGWFGNDDSGDDVVGSGSALGSRISGLVPPQVGRKKLKGIGGLGYAGDAVIEVDPNVMDWDRHTIRGTCTKLEKSYLRLTSEPSPADIRPLEVLKQTLDLIKSKWKTNHNYAYALDQFKSMRQDLTVQRIKNDFTVQVYEIHARIALESKDLGEYNQCQSMLRQLYELGLKGHPEEFLSYRIIYLLHTRNRSDMASLLAQLTPHEKADPGVHHALQVHAALATSNYARFFRLFLESPDMSGYIMDHFVERERATALAVMSKSYLTLPLRYLTTTLAFQSDAEADAFLESHNAAIYVPDPSEQAQPKRDPSNPWKPIKRPQPVPLKQRVWDAKKAQAACVQGIEKYRVVDLKGQVD